MPMSTKPSAVAAMSRHSMAQLLEGFKKALVDTSESSSTNDFIHDLLKDPQSMQVNRCTRYINQVFRYVESPPESRGTLINPQQFVYSLVELTIASYGLSPDSFAAVEHAIEDYIFPQIYTKLLPLCFSDDDLVMQTQYERFSSITQDQLKIDSSMIDESLSPWSHAIAKLSTLPLTPSPTRKLFVILSAAQSIYTNPNIEGDTSIGADVFVPIFIYVIVKSKIPNLWAEIKFIHEYGAERHFQGELGYYFVTLEFCSKYILDLTSDKLEPMSDEALLFQASTWLVAEKHRFQQWSVNFGYVSVLDNVVLKGVVPVVLSKFVLNRACPWSVVLKETGREEDQVDLLLMRAKISNLTTAQQLTIRKMFFEPQTYAEPLSTISTGFGSTIVIDPKSEMMEELGAIVLPTSSVDQSLVSVRNILILKLLGIDCGHVSDWSKVPQSAVISFRETFAAPPYVPLTDSIGGVLTEFQIYLKAFDCLPLIAPLTAEPDTPSYHGVLRFLTLYNGDNETGYGNMFGIAPCKFNVNLKYSEYTGYDISRNVFSFPHVEGAPTIFPFSFTILQCLRSLTTVVRSHLDMLGFAIPNPVTSLRNF
ncbi:hypothetical protein GEMRC1_003252 [Eukaryota sp. GEM-RC1]